MKKTWVIISIVFIVVGVILAAYGFAGGGLRNSVYVDAAGIHVSDDSGAVVSDMALAEFTGLDISAGYGDISVIPSDSYGIEMRLHNVTPAWSVEDGVLTIKESNTSRVNFGFWNTTDYVKIYVPAGVMLDSASIRADAGRINLNGFNAQALTAADSYGDVKLTDVKAGSLNITMSAGALTINDCDAGSVTVKNSYGRITANGLTAGGADIKASSGDVSLSGSFLGATKISSDLGKVSLTTAKSRSEYTCNVVTSLGNIRIDDAKIKGSGWTLAGNAENSIDITAKCGDVRVNFGK